MESKEKQCSCGNAERDDTSQFSIPYVDEEETHRAIQEGNGVIQEMLRHSIDAGWEKICHQYK